MKEPFSALSSISYAVAAYFSFQILGDTQISVLFTISLVILATGSFAYHASHSEIGETLDATGIYASFFVLLPLVGSLSVPSAEDFYLLLAIVSLFASIMMGVTKRDDKQFRAFALTMTVLATLFLLGLHIGSILIPLGILAIYLTVVLLFAWGNHLESNGSRVKGDLVHALLWHPLTAFLFYYIVLKAANG